MLKVYVIISTKTEGTTNKHRKGSESKVGFLLSRANLDSNSCESAF